jgi:hypothetical protein
LVVGTLGSAALLGLVAADMGATVDVLLLTAFGLASGYVVMQYADVRAAYSASLTGRALALLTMAMFLGVAAMQWFTGWVAGIAPRAGLDSFVATLWAIVALLGAGASAYLALPSPPAQPASKV